MGTVPNQTVTTEKNALRRLERLGQSVWIDFIRRGMISSGELRRLIEGDGVSGITSNPAIFGRAIGGSHDYDDSIRALSLAGKGAREIYDSLTIEDIREAADLLRHTFNRTAGKDGYVSIEVSPLLAHDTKGTIDEAHRLWGAIKRPNVMIKVPGTAEGVAAIRQLTADGINVNVTLLFGLKRYREIADAYISGLEERVKNKKAIGGIASVASFFLSRIDVLIDPMLEKIASGDDPSRTRMATALKGEMAIASAKLAWEAYRQIFEGERFRALLVRSGARPQKLLWASTSTKNPEYSDVKYVEPLIAPNTISTMPMETLTAYREHGTPGVRIEEDGDDARVKFAQCETLGIQMDEIAEQLEREGIEKFNRPYVDLLGLIEEKRGAAIREPVNRQVHVLGEYEERLGEWLDSLKRDDIAVRLWRKDPTIWTGEPDAQRAIRNSLGWLHAPEKMDSNLPEILSFAREVKEAGFKNVVLLGMGGSSMAPLVFQRTFTTAEEGIPLHVLDTTDPATIARIESHAPPAETFYVVSSKSGTTAEVRALNEYFYDRVKAIRGDRAGESFAVITDPRTPLAELARARRYRRIFLNFSDIGGRYSALSYFGLVPAALMGVNVQEILIRALRMRHACDSCVSIEQNPGIVLGAMLGEIAHHGADKVTFVIPPSISSLGLWCEQLIAESTGKEESGIVPVAGEDLGEPLDYDVDRLFIYLRLRDEIDESTEQKVAALEESGLPVITIHMDDGLDIGQEFFRWEIAVAIAGSILGINPFDQPNVQESKDTTERILDSRRRLGRLPTEEPAVSHPPLEIYGVRAGDGFQETMRAFFDQSDPWDYVAIMAFLPESPAVDRLLDGIRLTIRDRLHLATTVGYGPRFLHSTGQLHKGGRDVGLFLQITAESQVRVPIPGEDFDFATFIAAQAQGDLEVLRKKGKRAIRVHVRGEMTSGLEQLQDWIDAALPRRSP